MRDIPIIFSGPMVRALLDGRKTMTRRLAWRVEPVWSEGGVIPDGGGGQMDYVEPHWVTEGKPSPWQRVRPGDRLWVRETWAQTTEGFLYAADWQTLAVKGLKPWRSPIHCPRSVSRLTLIVAATKMERLRDMTLDDCEAEGWPGGDEAPYAIDWFEDLWKSLHGDDAWRANPEVVALTFTVHKQNIDALPKAAAA